MPENYSYHCKECGSGMDERDYVLNFCVVCEAAHINNARKRKELDVQETLSELKNIHKKLDTILELLTKK